MQSLSSQARGAPLCTKWRLWERTLKELSAISPGGKNPDQARALAGIHPDYFVRQHGLGQLIFQGLAHSVLDCVVPAQHSDGE